MSNPSEARQVVLDAIGYRVVECCGTCAHFAAMDYRGRNAVPIRIRLKGACCNPRVREVAAPIVAPSEVTAIDVHGSGSCDRWEADAQAVAVANPRAAVHTQPPLMPAKGAEQLREEMRARMQEVVPRPEPKPRRVGGAMWRSERPRCPSCALSHVSADGEVCFTCATAIEREP